MDRRPRTKRSTRALTLKLFEPTAPAQANTPAVFRFVDPPEEYDRDGDRMAAGALRLPVGEVDVPFLWEIGRAHV